LAISDILPQRVVTHHIEFPEAIASFLDEEAYSFEDCLLAKRLGKSE
jgi:hypothetical protein